MNSTLPRSAGVEVLLLSAEKGQSGLEQLLRGGRRYPAHVTAVASMDAVRARLRSSEVNVAVCDLSRSQSLDALRSLRQAYDGCIVAVVNARQGAEPQAVIAAGADECLLYEDANASLLERVISLLLRLRSLQDEVDTMRTDEAGGNSRTRSALHDIGDFLTRLSLNLYVAEHLHKVGDEVVKIFRDITLAVHQTKEIILKLTPVAASTSRRQVSSLHGMLEESALFALRGTRVTLRLSIADDLWMVRIDGVRIRQIFNNFIRNAAQAMLDEGRLDIRVRNVVLAPGQRRPWALPVLEDGSYVAVQFRDTGGGIRRQDRRRIFKAGYSTKSTGSGIGLATCLSIARLHGASIGVKSKLGSGSTFCLYLPAVLCPLELPSFPQ